VNNIVSHLKPHLDAFEQILMQSVDCIAALFGKVYILGLIGETDDALDILNRILTLDPHNETALEMKNEIEREEGEEEVIKKKTNYKQKLSFFTPKKK